MQDDLLHGNMVLFPARSGDEAASPFSSDEVEHEQHLIYVLYPQLPCPALCSSLFQVLSENLLKLMYSFVFTDLTCTVSS